MQLLIFLFLSWLSIGQITPVEESQLSQQDRPQYRIALSNVSNPSFTPSSEQLDIAISSGMSLFEVSSVSNVSIFTEENISLLFNADIPYPTVNALKLNKNSIIQSVTNDYLRLSNRQQSYIAAVGLFRYPADFSDGFNTAASSIADSISQLIDKPLYFRSFNREIGTPQGFSFVADLITVKNETQSPLSLSSAVIYLEPSASDKESLSTLAELMEATRELNESIIIIPAEWFFKIHKTYPAVTSVLKNYTNGRFLTMPLPADAPKPASANPGIILLVLIFAGLIIQYKYQPVVLQFMGRYFFNHSFFMTDIMDNRVRSISPGLTFIGIHSVVNGLFFLTLFETFFSDEGLNILSHYFAPNIARDFELLIIFISAVVIGLIVHLLSILWLRLLNREINSFSKSINLYIWPFIFTLIPTSLLVFNLHTGNFDLLAILMTALYLLTWLVSFATASINAARRLERYRALNIFSTVGVYSLIFAGLCTALVMVPSLFEPIELALNMP